MIYRTVGYVWSPDHSMAAFAARQAGFRVQDLAGKVMGEALLACQDPERFCERSEADHAARQFFPEAVGVIRATDDHDGFEILVAV